MNLPPVFSLLQASGSVTNIIGASPTRAYLFGTAPQNTPEPYLTWQLPVSVPENHLDRLPVVDNDRVQIDLWAQDPNDCINLAGAVRDALEPHAHMITKLNMGMDADSNLHRWVLEFTFWTPRT